MIIILPSRFLLERFGFKGWFSICATHLSGNKQRNKFSYCEHVAAWIGFFLLEQHGQRLPLDFDQSEADLETLIDTSDVPEV